jgi:hypothetical protein
VREVIEEMPPLVPTTVPYYTYLVFAENCVMAVLKLCTVGLMGLLLYSLRCRPNTLRVSRISISMMAYLGTHILCSLITLP